MSESIVWVVAAACVTCFHSIQNVQI